MTIYPIGHPVRWSAATPRRGAQSGTLTQPWQRPGGYPHIRWDGETSESKPLPECVEPVEADNPPLVAVGNVNAWAEHGKRRRV